MRTFLMLLMALALGLAACDADDETETAELGVDDADPEEPEEPDDEDDAEDDLDAEVADPSDDAEDDGPSEDDDADDEPGDDEPGDDEPGDDEPAEPSEAEPGEAEEASDDGEGPQPVGPFAAPELSSGDFTDVTTETVYLTDVRVGGHEGFDRVVLEFDGDEAPNWIVSYVDGPVVEDPSDQEIEVNGEAFLELRLTPATGVDLAGEDVEETYTGPDRVDAEATSAVHEVVRTSDFEATLAWVIGVDGERPVAVGFLSDPLRMVVDVEAE